MTRGTRPQWASNLTFALFNITSRWSIAHRTWSLASTHNQGSFKKCDWIDRTVILYYLYDIIKSVVRSCFGFLLDCLEKIATLTQVNPCSNNQWQSHVLNMCFTSLSHMLHILNVISCSPCFIYCHRNKSCSVCCDFENAYLQGRLLKCQLKTKDSQTPSKRTVWEFACLFILCLFLCLFWFWDIAH